MAWNLPDDDELEFIPPTICTECIMDDHGHCTLETCECRATGHTYYK